MYFHRQKYQLPTKKDQRQQVKPVTKVIFVRTI